MIKDIPGDLGRRMEVPLGKPVRMCHTQITMLGLIASWEHMDWKNFEFILALDLYVCQACLVPHPSPLHPST